MAQFVAVFDVVVHERIVVQHFDRERRVERVLERAVFVARDLKEQPRP